MRFTRKSLSKNYKGRRKHEQRLETDYKTKKLLTNSFPNFLVSVIQNALI